MERPVSRIAAAAATGLLIMGACNAPGAGQGGGSDDPVTVRLGYFPNVTHATAIVGVAQGLFADALGGGVHLETTVFNAGTDATEALFSGALDASYMGPNPATNAFVKSGGTAVRVIAGATSGGAALVVRAGIEKPADLAGSVLATPSLGNTQDVALRTWLADQGLSATREGGGDVDIMPQANGDALTAFVSGHIDGAWVPEPWATRMVREGGGHVLVDERDLWPDGAFVTTLLVISTDFLDAHPDVVKGLLRGHVAATAFVNEHPEQAQEIVTTSIADLTGAKLPAGTIGVAWQGLAFTNDPIASSLYADARDAKALGFLETDDLAGIFDLALLNEVLVEAGATPVPSP